MVEILEESDQLIVRIGGQEYCRYQYGEPRWKPYIYPIRATNGLSLVADAPTDHRHHHGLWIGHARVGGVDFWLERYNSGKILHKAFTYIGGGEELGGFESNNDWIAPDGQIGLKDTRRFTFYESPSSARYFDIDVSLRTPGDESVELHPTNEAGIPHIRASEGLTVRTGGTLTNADGKTNERGTYKQRSPWLDCSGKLGRQACGIALLEHPGNPEFPSPWFTRDYGPFSPNYGFFNEDPIVITPETPLRLRFRVFSHSGDVLEADVAAVWENYRAQETVEPKRSAKIAKQ